MEQGHETYGGVKLVKWDPNPVFINEWSKETIKENKSKRVHELQ